METTGEYVILPVASRPARIRHMILTPVRFTVAIALAVMVGGLMVVGFGLCWLWDKSGGAIKPLPNERH